MFRPWMQDRSVEANIQSLAVKPRTWGQVVKSKTRREKDLVAREMESDDPAFLVAV